MILKSPSNDWSDQFDIIEEEYDSLSEVEEETDFSEYLWMENEEEFDKDELQRLEEEEMMQQCLEAMLVDELEAEIDEWQKEKAEQLDKALSDLAVPERNVENSSLNPLAEEFIPMENYFIDLIIS
ncbi:polyadenylate-binding protein-interacting protein 2 [Episyrphus balteatus]|uniref:polyadenylate-binding protein-interacting protein 2 n=1 Tax=Episyrphus balteatus TaxID=286459 RepID=UPI002485D11A|nr:polyadenylate-binding protein-interacting protein 2 [Episyrphus balteatus]